MPGLEVHLLGPVEATFDDRPLRLGATKQRVVLAILALHANTAVSAERLIEGLWGEDPPPSAAKLLQLYVSQLRRALAGAGAEIVTHGRGYELRVPPDVVDAKRLERLVDAAARSRTDAGGAREALALWRGGALADVAEEPFAAPEVRRLEELRLRATELAIDADLASGRHDDVVGELHRLVDEHPLRERFHAQRMLALYRSGRQAEALEAYQCARQILVSAIGVEPGAELRALQDAILRQDPALDPPSAGGGTEARFADTADDGRPAVGSRAAPAMPNRSSRFWVSASRRALIAAAGAVMVGGVLAFAVIRSSGPDRLPGIDENAVGRIDTSRSGIVEQYGVGRGAGTTAVGAGSVWTANTLDGTVSRIDPRREVATIDVGDDVAGLAYGAGSLWVAGGNRALSEVNPASNRVVRRIEFGNAPGSVAVGFGAVWVTVPVDGRVVRVDLASGRRRSIGVGADPAAIAVGDRAVWVAMQSVGTVVRIEPRSGAVVAAIGVGNQPSAIAVSHGAVWVANRQDNTVSRIDPATDAVTDLVPVGAQPGALAVAANGVWVGSEGDGSVARIDLVSRRIRDRISLDSAPRGIAVTGRDVWVAAGPLPNSHTGGTLRVRMDRVGVDPAEAGYDPEGVPLVALVYDGLVAYRRVGGTAGNVLVGDLATSVPAPSADGRAYVFTLRRGLRYADGTPVRAGDFRASMQRLLRTVGHDVPLYESVVGVTRCERDPKRCDLSRGIVADERARTITLHLTRADPNLIWNLAIPAASFVGPERPGPADAPPPVGTGPYRVSRLDKHTGALLVRNPRFRSWSQDARPDGRADRIEVTVASGVKTQARAVARGAADLVPYFGGALASLPGVAAQYTSEVRSGDYPDMEFAFLNTRIPPFDHRDAREAINYATDRARLADLIGGRQIAAPTCQILPPGLPGHRPFCPFTVAPNPAGAWIGPNLVKARRLVTASGTRGQRVAIWASAERPAYGVYFAQLLRKLGYRPTLRRFPKLQALVEAAAKPTARPQLGLYAWIADFPDPANYVRQLLACASAAPSPPAGNLSRFCDPRLDAAVERAASTPGAAPIAAWRRIEQRVADASPIVPILNLRSAVLVSRRTGDVQFHPILGVLLDRMWVR